MWKKINEEEWQTKTSIGEARRLTSQGSYLVRISKVGDYSRVVIEEVKTQNFRHIILTQK